VEDRTELGDYEVPFKGIVEQSFVGIYILQDGRFKYVNETFAHMCGLRRDQLMGARLRDVVHPKQAAALISRYERRIQDGAPNDPFVIRRTLQERPGSFEIHGTRVIFDGRPAIVGVGIDITEQERQRQDLLHASARLQELISNANSVRENERNRVARELHDVIGGMLTAIKFDLTRLTWGLERLAASPSARVDGLKALTNTARELIQLTQETVESVRSISEGLRPGALDHLGLSDTLAQNVARFEARYGITAKLSMRGSEHPLDRSTEIGIYRIFQEALTNVARHSKATEVTVDLDWGSVALRLCIADNGLGFDTETKHHEGHLGLLGMQERARELGGDVKFDKSPRSGACITLTVPLSGTDHAQGDVKDDKAVAR